MYRKNLLIIVEQIDHLLAAEKGQEKQQMNQIAEELMDRQIPEQFYKSSQILVPVQIPGKHKESCWKRKKL